jgi:hypothetical protein
MLQAYGLDMSQYLSLFHSTRIPKVGRDELKSYPESTHVVVQRGADFYSVNVLESDGTAVYSAPSLPPPPSPIHDLATILAESHDTCH